MAFNNAPPCSTHQEEQFKANYERLTKLIRHCNRHTTFDSTSIELTLRCLEMIRRKEKCS
eukprot:16255664-Heterocapsa_arctica.AAC.1